MSPHDFPKRPCKKMCVSEGPWLKDTGLGYCKFHVPVWKCLMAFYNFTEQRVINQSRVKICERGGNSKMEKTFL